ncbi:Uncharacterised protein [Serratia fonticola]|nr:Uncharacterised protein [Serratia fonticola]CAI1954145.1 Uncharacterised protein [Serratia fonticola]
MLTLWSDRAFGQILKAMENTGDWELSEGKGEKTADTHRRFVSDYIRICSILAISSALNLRLANIPTASSI